jgi:uncharacterized protein YciI
MRAQDGWDEHAAFMDGLDADGFVVLGGPLGADELEFLFLVEAETEDAVRIRLDADPWTPTGQIAVARIEPWRILLGDAPGGLDD